MSNNNLYDELELSPNCTVSDIKHQYRTLAQIHHPDKGGDEEKFKRIKLAYEILSDPITRSHYDSTGEHYDDASITTEVFNRLSVMIEHFTNQLNPEFDDLILKMKLDLHQAQKQSNTAIGEINNNIKKLTIISTKIKLKNDGENLLKYFVEKNISKKQTELDHYKRTLLVFDKMLDILENYHYSNNEWQLLLENVDGPA